MSQTSAPAEEIPITVLVKPVKKHYIDSKKLYEEMKVYIDACRKAKRRYIKTVYKPKHDLKPDYKLNKKDHKIINNEYPKAQISEYIGECIMKIATKLSHKSRFYNYSYKDICFSEAYVNVIKYLDRFKPEKSTNAFAWITQIIKCAFVRVLEQESKHQYIRSKLIQNGGILDEYATQAKDSGTYSNSYGEFLRDNMTDIIVRFEDGKQRSKEKMLERKREKMAELSNVKKRQPLKKTPKIDEVF